MTNICLVAADFDNAGVDAVSRRIFELADEAIAAGYGVIVFHAYNDSSAAEYAIDEYRLINGAVAVRLNQHSATPWNDFGDESIEAALAQAIAAKQVGAVHFLHRADAIFPALIERVWNMGVPCHLTLFEGELRQQPNDALLTRALRLCDSVTTASPDVNSNLSRTWIAETLTADPDAATWAATYGASIDLPADTPSGRVTVAISTYNRPELLRLALASFENQTLPKGQFEVVVVDDCSNEDQRPVVDEFAGRLDVQFIRHETNRGLGQARNTAVAAAAGDIVVFFDDDDVAGPRFLEEHLRTHQAHPEPGTAVLGFIGIDASITPTNVLYSTTQTLMTYLSYPGLPHGAELPWHCAWGGASSFKTALLRANSYEVAWMEDIDLAWRLRSQGLKVVFNRHAVQYLRDTNTFDEWLARCGKHGRAAAQLSARHQDGELDAHLGVIDAATRAARLHAMLPDALDVIRRFDPMPRSEVRAAGAEGALDNAYMCAFEAARLDSCIEERRRAAKRGQTDGKRILVVDLVMPLYDRNSGSHRLWRLLQMMLADGHEVTFVALNAAGQERYVAELERMGIEVIAGDPERLQRAFGASFPGVAPLDLPRLLATHNFDLAYLCFYYVAEQYITDIRRYSPQTRIVVDSIDVHYVRERRQASIEGNTKLAEQSELTRQRERSVYLQADDVIAITAPDRSAIEQLSPGIRTWIIPNVHDTTPDAPGPKKRNGLLFVGNFNHPANGDGINWFCSDVWPAVRKALPSAQLTIVGANAPAHLVSLPGVQLAGYVPSMRPFLNAARVSIAPLRHGAGMKGKVGEAMAAGLPVVSTSIGTEGMGVHDGAEALVADDLSTFVAAIIRLHKDDALWRHIAEGGRALIDRLYGADTVAKMLRAVISGPSNVEPEILAAVPDWNDPLQLESLLEDYTATHSAGDRSTLIVATKGVDVDTAGGLLLAALERIGKDPQNIPDIDVVEWSPELAKSLPSTTRWLTRTS